MLQVVIGNRPEEAVYKQSHGGLWAPASDVITRGLSSCCGKNSRDNTEQGVENKTWSGIQAYKGPRGAAPHIYWLPTTTYEAGDPIPYPRCTEKEQSTEDPSVQ